MPNAPISRSPWIDVRRDLSLPVDPVAVHPLAQEALEPLHEGPGPLHVRRIGLRGRGAPGRAGSEPSNSSRTKLGACHSFSRAASATSRASCSVASGVPGGPDRGGEDVSHGSRARVRVAATGRASPRRPCSTRSITWRLRRSRSSGSSSVDADRRGDGARVNEGEPAERDDAEQQLRRLARRRVVEPELGADRGQRLLAGRELVARPSSWPAAAQRLALDQPDEVRAGGEKVEVVGDGAGQNGLGRLAAGQRPRPARPHRLADLGEAALQHRLVELGLGAEEVARRSPGNSGGRADLAQAGGVVPLLGKQTLRGVEDRGAGAVGVAFLFASVAVGRMASRVWLACCPASYGPGRNSARELSA